MKIRSLPTELTPKEAQRFSAKVKFAGYDECWEWRGTRNAHEYGVFKLADRKNALAHRLSYSIMVGEIPAGLVIDHLCRNHSCINPNHLEPVTSKVNSRRGQTNAAKTKCPKGHPYDLITERRRRCSICYAESVRKSNARRKIRGQ